MADTNKELKRRRRSRSPSPRQRSAEPQNEESKIPRAGACAYGAVCVWADEWGGPVVWVSDEDAL
jgi:hypothetical protein